jgi:hypothetical protein
LKRGHLDGKTAGIQVGHGSPSLLERKIINRR